MINPNEAENIKKIVGEFMEKMGESPLNIFVIPLNEGEETAIESVDVDIEVSEPQMLIGQRGQTLFDIQRILRAIMSRNLKKFLYVNLDINSHKKKKAEYLKNLANRIADEVLFVGEERILPPMENYERRIVHMALSERKDVKTESRGEKDERRVIISPANIVSSE